MSTLTNGINTEKLLQTIGAIKDNPDLARFQFRARSEWITGGRSRTRIRGFYGAGTEDSSRTEDFVLEGDEPPVLLGTDTAPNAVEAVLYALASCLAVGIAYNAAAQGISIRNLALDLEGDLDLQGFLGLSETIRPGYSGIRVICHIDSDASPGKIQDLLAHVQKTSPVMDVVRNPVPVSVTLGASTS